MFHSIQMGTPKGERLLDCLLHLSSRMLLMQPQDADKLFDPSAIRPFLPQLGEQAVVGCWPICSPLP